MLDEGVQIRAGCEQCQVWQAVDLQLLERRKGRGYSLINRRARCAFTPDCKGWVRFTYLLGVYRPLWDEVAVSRWMIRDRDTQ